MTVNEYRRKHRRCRTCLFSYQNNYSSFYGSHTWYCKAKAQIYEGQVAREKLKGCLCDLYEPKPADDCL